MDLKIDITNQEELLDAEKELSHLLSVVRFALQKNITANLDNSPESLIKAAISKAPEMFKSTAIYNAVSTEHRSSVKAILSTYLAEGKIRVHEIGKARRPTIYQKVT